MNYLLRNFFLGMGGLIRWFIFQFINILLSKNYPKDVDYYLVNENESLDNNGFTKSQKNFISGIIVFVIILLIIEKIE
jgi:hypothetical protein